ncbi:hypothetical protein [Streptomyces roseolilacinus]|uniref:hypothetical protein n=1 Tax=Streptomyces roseolilacinus TaxID=66904 RepID=UPI00380AC02D
MADVSPDGVIMAAWRPVEAKLVDMVLGYDDHRQRFRFFRAMTQSDLAFPKGIMQALTELKQVRNEVTHVTADGRMPSSRSAEYAEGCESMVRWLGEYEQSPSWRKALEKFQNL